MRLVEERAFAAHDGVRLFYRYWPGTQPKAIVLLHRGHEHSGRMAHVAEELDLPDFAIFALDARAHGRSGGDQDINTSMGTFAQDLDEFVRHIQSEYEIPVEDIAIVAQSIGAVIAAAWVHDYAPSIRCMVLAAPAFHVKLYVPFARLGLGLWHSIAGDFFVNSYIKASALTHDPERIASYATDPLIKRPISARVLLGLYETAARIVEDAAAIRVPTQLLLSGSDWVVNNKPSHTFLSRLDTPETETHTFEGFLHDILGEKDRHLPITKARDFLERQFSKPSRRSSLANADQSGYTKTEYDSLNTPLPLWSPKRWSFALTRLFMRTIGRSANGIRIGLETGFDSGSSLDYVYRNQASGWTPIGKLIDWFYLNSIGWRGIRIRKQSLEAVIAEAIQLLSNSKLPLRILDLAAGHGRYVIDAIKKSGAQPDDILLRDLMPDNVTTGRALAADSGLKLRFILGDAFDFTAIAALTPKPTLGIVSGLFELFPENAPIRRCLSGIASAIAPGGYLIYTGQPWHPQIEMIARTLNNHQGEDNWVMRRRTQEELDELIRSAGFRKVAQRMDSMGLFTVSLAERI